LVSDDLHKYISSESIHNSLNGGIVPNLEVIKVGLASRDLGILRVSDVGMRVNILTIRIRQSIN